MPSTEADSVEVRVNPPPIDETHIRVVAAILFDPEVPGRFLIAQRQRGKHLEHLWEFPGGKIESGESRWTALRRELREEIGIDATSGEPFMQVYCRYPEINVLLDVWNVREYSGEVSARERQRLRWIGIDEIDGYRFPPADLPILEAIGSSALAEN